VEWRSIAIKTIRRRIFWIKRIGFGLEGIKLNWDYWVKKVVSGRKEG